MRFTTSCPFHYLGGAKNKIISSPTVHFGLTEVFGGPLHQPKGYWTISVSLAGTEEIKAC